MTTVKLTMQLGTTNGSVQDEQEQATTGSASSTAKNYEGSEYANYRATAGEVQGLGSTPRSALDSLLPQLPEDEMSPIVIWPYNRGDRLFSDEQQARLQELKARQDTSTEAERQELEKLVEDSFNAAIARTEAVALVKR